MFAIGLAAMCAASVISAQSTPQATPAADAPAARPNDYSDGATWLCRPGRQDACAVDLTATVIASDGTMTRETTAANLKAPIDCFYVYPTSRPIRRRPAI